MARSIAPQLVRFQPPYKAYEAVQQVSLTQTLPRSDAELRLAVDPSEH